MIHAQQCDFFFCLLTIFMSTTRGLGSRTANLFYATFNVTSLIVGRDCAGKSCEHRRPILDEANCGGSTSSLSIYIDERAPVRMLHDNPTASFISVVRARSAR
ncbi:hypothetical protein OF83DRAFT_36252 [Amylostereum chailletii]|nr:hypothetical protein OF83DRAFT_36252 [Amylostereum chailletii]